jgi:ATP-dependent helicase HrpB
MPGRPDPSPIPLPPLPIDPVLPELVAALGRHPNAVLRAPTGAGKTTRVPPALLAAGIAGDDGTILMLEPRRVAARAAARRIAQENGWELGREVGYQVRFERKASAATRILVVTEGLLVGRLQSDPFLEGVAVVLFDEIHERSLDTDLALALARKVQREVRDDLHLVAMSATLEIEPLVRFLGDAPVVDSPGRLYPVEVRHLATDRHDRSGSSPRSPRAIAARAAEGVRAALEDTPGGVLAFLPGVGEIRRTETELSDLPRRGIPVMPLYGALPPERQDAVLSPSAGRRVILATNVAETSVTVPGVTAVVDTGLARRLLYDPARGLDRLELGRIGRASAEQRAGRAGREAPGLAIRLWPEHEPLPEREEPEIRRVDLTGPVLQLLDWGEPDPAAFEWFEAPPPATVERALDLLTDLGALDRDARTGGLTDLGKQMAALPLHPRLARLVIEGRRLGVLDDAALTAALLSERDPLPVPRLRFGDPPRAAGPSDLAERLEALHAVDAGRPLPYPTSERLRPGSARFVLRARDQVLRQAGGGGPDRPPAGMSHDEALGRSLLAAFPDRLARRRGPRDETALMGGTSGGAGVKLAPESVLRAYTSEDGLFLALDVSGARPGDPRFTESLVRQAVAVEASWIPEELRETRVETELDPESGRVKARRRTRVAGLVIDEAEVPAPAEDAARVLAEAAAEDPEGFLPLDEPAVASFLSRLRFLAHARPELELPTFERDELVALLPPLTAGRRSREDLRRAPLLETLKGGLSWNRLQLLDEQAPERLRVPSGRHHQVTYEPGKPPVLAVRIQEMFGATETPTVAGGRVKVLLHLLAPNYRPQQVTDDLAGFWVRTYPEVRKELAGRYPKHAWPEEP